MAITISFKDALAFILSISGTALLIYLAIAVSNLNGILMDVKSIVNKNKTIIDNTISSLPAIASNVKLITGEIRDGVSTIASTAETIQENISRSSGSITEKTDIAVDYIRILSELIKTGTRYISKRK